MGSKKSKFGKEKDLGSCQFCGEPIKETSLGWGCFTNGCGAFIYRKDHFFEKVLGMRISKSYACKLLMGDVLKLNHVEVKGNPHDIELSWGLTDDARFKYGYSMLFVDKDKYKERKETKSDQVTGFDVINGD